MVLRPAALWPSAAGRPVSAEMLEWKGQSQFLILVYVCVNYSVHTGRHRPRMLIRHLVGHNLSWSCPKPLPEGSLLPRSTAHQPSVLETVAATVWDSLMDGLMRNMKTSRLPIQSCSAVDAVSHQTAPRAQIEKKKILIMQPETLRAPFQPITSLILVPRSRRNRPKSHPSSGYFIVNWPQRLEYSKKLGNSKLQFLSSEAQTHE